MVGRRRSCRVPPRQVLFAIVCLCVCACVRASVRACARKTPPISGAKVDATVRLPPLYTQSEWRQCVDG